MQVFVKLKALGSASVEDLLHALLTKLPLPPPNGTSLAVRPALACTVRVRKSLGDSSCLQRLKQLGVLCSRRDRRGSPTARSGWVVHTRCFLSEAEADSSASAGGVR